MNNELNISLENPVNFINLDINKTPDSILKFHLENMTLENIRKLYKCDYIKLYKRINNTPILNEAKHNPARNINIALNKLSDKYNISKDDIQYIILNSDIQFIKYKLEITDTLIRKLKLFFKKSIDNKNI